MRGVLLGVLLVGLGGGAVAQERPLVLPSRDVDVVYRIAVAGPAGGPAGGQAVEQRSRFSAAAQRMRVDMPTPGVYSIMDYRAHRMSFVVEGDRAALDTPVPVPGSPAYVRLGVDQVAGLACTEWQTQDRQGQGVVTCFTADGVMLRVRRGAQAMAVATRVDYGPVAPGVFEVPAGFSHVTGRGGP